MAGLERCPWCLKDDVYKHYHDTVWGVPEHDDRTLFAKLILDGAQAGLSWYAILVRTDAYNRAFVGGMWSASPATDHRMWSV
jgi:DNA-3-methyladenine glycosylase I